MLFIHVPNNEQIRKKLLKLARREDAHSLSADSRIYFCEDQFDGSRLTLGDLLDEVDALEMSDAAFIDCSADGVLEIGRRLPEIPDTFVDRTLFSSCHMRTDFFSSLNRGDVCVMTEGTSYCQQDWLPPEHQIRNFTEFDGSARGSSGVVEGTWILLDDWDADNQFQDLCNDHKNKRFFWIENDAYGCKIRRTNCGVEYVRRYLMSDIYTGHTIEEAIDSYRVTVLSGGPGMGKSTVTACVAREIKKRDPSLWVIVLNLAHCLTLNQEAQFDDMDSVTRFLCTAEQDSNSNNRLSETLLNFALRKTSNTVVLIDDTDDLHKDLRQIFRSMIHTLSTNKNIRKLWVTSRGSGGFDVEELTGALSFRIGAFTNEEKEKFYDAAGNTRLTAEIKGKFLTNSLLSTPLFAKLFLEGITKDADNDKFAGEYVVVSDQNTLFEKFVEMKLETYFEKRLLVTEGAEKVKNILRNAYYEHFTYEAVKLLLPRAHVKKMNITDYKQVDDLEDIGVITCEKNGARGFIHKTFAEYFMARWFAEVGTKYQYNLEDIYENSQFGSFCELFSRKLCQNFRLHQICANDAEEELKPFLQADVTQLKERDRGGRNLLHICSIFNSVRCAKYIIKRLSFCLNEQDEVLRWTPLKYAVNFRSWGIVDLLLEAGISYKNFNKCMKGTNMKKEGLFADFCLGGHSNILKHLVSNKVITPAWRWEPLGLTALHLVVMNGHDTELIAMLLRAKADVKARTTGGQTVLHMAAKRKDSVVVKLLTEHGAVVNVADNAGLTPLHCAALTGNGEAVGILLQKKADWRLRTRREETALHLSGSDSVVRTLLATGLGLEHRDWLGRTPLHHAAGRRVPEVVKALLDAGADVMARDNVGNTPLHLAVSREASFDSRKEPRESNLTDVMQCLIDKGADINAQNSSRKSPLHLAVEYSTVSAVQLLVDGGADLYCRDKNGCIPLHMIAKNVGFNVSVASLPPGITELCNPDSVNNLVKTQRWFLILRNFGVEETRAIIDYLIPSKMCDFTARDNEAGTVLHYSALTDNEYVICKILEFSKDVNVADSVGKTPLHLAALAKRKSVVQKLISSGANVNARDKCGNTPLHCACDPWRSQETNSSVHNLRKISKTIKTLRKLPLRDINTSAAGIESLSASVSSLMRSHSKSRLDVMGSVTVLLDNQADVYATNSDRLTAVHFAALKGFTKVLRIFYGRGINLDVANEKKITPLHLASDHVHEEAVRYLLHAKANANAAGLDDNRPLHIASYKGHLNITETLIKAGAVIDAVNKEGRTALHLAAAEGHKDVVDCLLNFSASVNAIDKLGRIPLHAAAQYGHVNTVDVLIKAGSHVDAANKEGRTALHLAAAEGHKDVVDCLLNSSASVNAVDKLDHIPLHAAAQYGHVNTVDVLIKAGAHVDAANKEGAVPLHLATLESHTDVVVCLISSGACVNATDNFGNKPLHIAAHNGHMNTVNELIKVGADVFAKNKIGAVPLHRAAQEGHMDVVLRLLRSNPNANVVDHLGNRPLHAAAHSGHVNTVDVLIKAGAQVDAANVDGHTALELAALNGQVDVVVRLLRSNASVNATNNLGNSPLYAAAQNGHVKTVDVLIGNGADVDAANKEGAVPLHKAAYNGHEDVVRLLLRSNANANVSDHLGNRPLHDAAHNGHVNTVDVLIKAGAHVDAANTKGQTALHLASEKGHEDVVLLLISFNANVNAADNRGNRALHVAAYCGRMNVVEVLIKEGADVEAVNIDGLTARHAANLMVMQMLRDASVRRMPAN